MTLPEPDHDLRLQYEVLLRLSADEETRAEIEAQRDRQLSEAQSSPKEKPGHVVVIRHEQEPGGVLRPVMGECKGCSNCRGVRA